MNFRFSRSRTKRKSCSNFLRPHGALRSSTTTPFIDWLWANEPEDARKLQLERLLLEVMEETVDWALAIGSDGVKHDLDFRTAIVERFEDALKAKAMKLPDRFTKDAPAYPRSDDR
jgi:hypothetical protein